MSVLRPATMAGVQARCRHCRHTGPWRRAAQGRSRSPRQALYDGLTPTDHAGPGLNTDGAGMKRREVR